MEIKTKKDLNNVCNCECCDCLDMDHCYEKQHGCCGDTDSFGDSN